jgi:anti-sigma B factor antagonist
VLSIAVRQSRPVSRVGLAGELDIETAPQLVECIEREVAQGRSPLAVDLQALTFCDSRGLAALLQAFDLCLHAGGTLSVVGATGPVARVLDITGVGEMWARGSYPPGRTTQPHPGRRRLARVGTVVRLPSRTGRQVRRSSALLRRLGSFKPATIGAAWRRRSERDGGQDGQHPGQVQHPPDDAARLADE